MSFCGVCRDILKNWANITAPGSLRFQLKKCASAQFCHKKDKPMIMIKNGSYTGWCRSMSW